MATLRSMPQQVPALLSFLALLSVPLCSALNAWGTLGTEHGGSCGYAAGFPKPGTFLTGFSTSIYQKGLVCGGCYVVSCQGSRQCRGGTVLVTATNECMATNSSDPCALPNSALNLQPIAFDQISRSRAPGVVGIKYTEVECPVATGLEFKVITGNNDYISVLVQNVGGPGALSAVSLKAGAGPLVPMSRSFGAVWQAVGVKVLGLPLSFVLVGWNGEKIFVPNALPANWKPQALYQAKLNFNWPKLKAAAP